MYYLLSLFFAIIVSTSVSAQQVIQATYLGRGNGYTRDVEVDEAGNIYAVGGTRDPAFPTTTGVQQPVFGGYEDAFAVKIDPTGRLIWATYLGGSKMDRAYASDLDGQGNLVIAGRAGAGFPVTPGAAQRTFMGGATSGSVYPHPQDGFVAKLNTSNGKLVWASYFGGTDSHASIVRDVTADRVTGELYIAASTNTATLPQVIKDALLRGSRRIRPGGIDGLAAKISADGSRFEWVNYVGGSGSEQQQPSVVLDAAGNPIFLYVTSSTNIPTTVGAYDRSFGGAADFYAVKFSRTSQLLWATYFGGSGDESGETHNLAIRRDGTVVIAGRVTTGWPTTIGAFDRTANGTSDCGIALLSATGTQLIASTFLGGNVGDMCEGVDVDDTDLVYLGGRTTSANFPVTIGATQTIMPGPISPIIAIFSPDLSILRYATFYGGPTNGVTRSVTAHPNGNGHVVAGFEIGINTPVVNPITASADPASCCHPFLLNLSASLP